MHWTRPRAPMLAWLGGGAFLGALAWFAYVFFVRFDRVPTTGPVLGPVLTDVALFGVFATHHSVLARGGVKRWLTRRVPAHLERSLYVWTASLLFIAVCAWWRDVPGEVYRRDGLAAIPHWSVVALGAWLTARSAAVIDPLDLAGIRQASGQTTPQRFRVVGAYRWVRHPIYLGWLLLVFGVPHMTATRLTFAVISSAYLVAAISFEERSLVETVGPAYREYQRDVRWRLIPGVW